MSRKELLIKMMNLAAEISDEDVEQASIYMNPDTGHISCSFKEKDGAEYSCKRSKKGEEVKFSKTNVAEEDF